MSLCAFSGLWNLDGASVDVAELNRSAFRSPEWEPDGDTLEVEGSFAAVAVRRNIVPEDFAETLPWRDPASGCVLVADSYLTHRGDLARELGLDASLPDSALILAAYARWGVDCPRHLHGAFGFVLFDPRARRLLAATDPFGQRGFYYSHLPGKRFAFANTLAPLRALLPQATLDPEPLGWFTLDARQPGRTCYREVLKIPYASTLVVDANGLKVARYAKHGGKPPRLRGRSREALHAQFREAFEATVRDYARTEFPLAAQLSGGMDSTAVACVAARQKAAQGRPLHVFTSAPRELSGLSRGRWDHHELHKVDAAVAMHPNMRPVVFRTRPEEDPFLEAGRMHPFSDLPYRNIYNLHWIRGSLRHARDAGARVILTGSHGNGGLSWTGATAGGLFASLRKRLRMWARPERVFNDYYRNHLPAFLQRPATRKILRGRGLYWGLQRELSAPDMPAPMLPSLRVLSLWHGVEMLDPTGDSDLAELFRALPVRAYRRGLRHRPLQDRLLVREGLADVVPKEVRLDERRGEQASDWFLHYNLHAATWRDRLENLHPGAAALLWSWYDRERIFAHLDAHPRFDGPPSREVHQNLAWVITRCLSLAFFLDDLHRGPA